MKYLNAAAAAFIFALFYITAILATLALAAPADALTRAAALKRAAIKNSATYCAVCSSVPALYGTPTAPQSATDPAPVVEGGTVVGQ